MIKSYRLEIENAAALQIVGIGMRNLAKSRVLVLHGTKGHIQR